VALETGISVGTLYDYFPNKKALLSVYFRHCIDVLLVELDAQAVAPQDLPWRQRVHHLLLVAPPGLDAHAWTTQMEHACCAALTA
jgi:AcrR family transcriptional regulator